MSVEIFLDGYQNVCYPGQTISGRVECQFHEVENFRAVKVEFKGHATTEWNDTEYYYNEQRGRRDYRQAKFHAEEVYIHTECNLVPGWGDCQLPAGKHVYPFSYVLPTQLPSSFEGTYGGVRYYVKAMVTRPAMYDYESPVVPINVVTPLDLNYIPGLKDAVSVSDEKIPCTCWCNDPGIITFNLSLPVSGYAPGQDVNVGAYLQNMTNLTLESVNFKIIAKYEYITHQPSIERRYNEELLVETIEGAIGAHAEKSWTTTLNVPTIFEYPNLMSCNILNVNYILMAKAVLPLPHLDLDLEIPLTIGTVPLSGVNTTLPGTPPIDINIEFPAEGDHNYPKKYPEGPPPAGLVPFAPSADASSSYPESTAAPHPSGSTAPYPAASAPAPYPVVAAAPYPSASSTAASYPPSLLTAAPHTGDSTSPYPAASGPSPCPGDAPAPYPPASSTAAPYPLGSTAPYPAASDPAPYPEGVPAPYPPASSTSALYPPSLSAAAPYMPLLNGNLTPAQQGGWTSVQHPRAISTLASYSGRGTDSYPENAAAPPYPGASVPATAASYLPGPSTATPYPLGPSAALQVGNETSEKSQPQRTGWYIPKSSPASELPPPSYEDSQKEENENL